MECFEYFLELSMATSDSDRDALREAHASLAALNDDCCVPAPMWSVWASTRRRPLRFRIAA